MAKWKLITLLIFLVMTGAVVASPIYPKCEDTVEINTNCTMITPVLACATFDYNITNATGGNKVVEQASLAPLNDSVYYFNFTQGRGSYIITLCDGTSREVTVKEDVNKMIVLAAIILLPLIISGLMFYVSSRFEGEHHWAMHMGLILIGFLFILISFGFGIQIVAKYLNFPELQDVLGFSLFGYGMFFYLILFYVAINVLIMLILVIRNKKVRGFNRYEKKRQG